MTDDAVDITTIERAQRGDDAARDALFRGSYEAVVALVKSGMSNFLRSREESADVAQSVFRQIIVSDAFVRAQFTGPDAFNRWLTAVVQNKLVDHARTFAAAKRGSGTVGSLGPPTDSEGSAGAPTGVADPRGISPLSAAEQSETVRLVREMLPELPSDDHRAVIEMHYFARLGTPEIAARLRVDERRVRRLRAEALAMLAQRFDVR